jgi:methenyltetrahydromethanopterin cyclohydrolase
MSNPASFRMNERAWTMASAVEPRADELRIAVHTLSNGTRILDAGIEVPGGLAAGRRLVELCMGGLGHVDFVPLKSPSSSSSLSVRSVRSLSSL